MSFVDHSPNSKSGSLPPHPCFPIELPDSFHFLLEFQHADGARHLADGGPVVIGPEDAAVLVLVNHDVASVLASFPGENFLHLPCERIDFATKRFMMIANATTRMGWLHLCNARVRVKRERRGRIPIPLRQKDAQGLA